MPPRNNGNCCSLKPLGGNAPVIMYYGIVISGGSRGGGCIPHRHPQCTETDHFEVQNGKKNLPLPTPHPSLGSWPPASDYDKDVFLQCGIKILLLVVIVKIQQHYGKLDVDDEII